MKAAVTLAPLMAHGKHAPSRPATLVRARELAVPALRIAAVAFGAMVVIALGLRVAHAGALPGVTVAGEDLSGMDAARIHDAMSALDRTRRAQTISVVRAPVPDAGATTPARIEATGEELGYELDVDATVDRILRRGRQLNPFAAFADQMRAFFSATTVHPVQRVDDEEFGKWLGRAVRRLRVEPVEGSLAFSGRTVARIEPKPGAAVRREGLRQDVLAALFGRAPLEVRARTRPVTPLTTAADVDAVEADARLALSAPVLLRHEDVTVTLTPADLGAVLEVERVEEDEATTLRLVASPVKLREQIPDDVLAQIERDAEDARFVVSGASISVIASRDGFAFDAEAAAAQVTGLALKRGDRSAVLTGEVTEPDLTTEQARALEITEQVSTFTTNFPCCQSRVRNIHRMAELVDGVVIQPDETFSLNQHVGPRTEEKGFASGGAIYDGEFVEQIGGGVSQFTTTMFNAAFFGGYAIPVHKAHSYYISRYPVGREATLNWPSVDLKIHNNSPHGILVKTAVSGTSVTVSFYGTKWVEVRDHTGPRRNVKPPGVKYKDNPALPPGTEKEISSGREGFDITVTRTLVFPDGREESEKFFTRYLPEPRVIERNTASPGPSPSPGATPPPGGSPPPSDGPTPPPQ